MPRTKVKEEDYEIIPHQVLRDLRNEVEELKNRIETEPKVKLEQTVTDLKSSMESLQDIFSAALGKYSEESEEQLFNEFKVINERMGKIEKQNQQIAEGLVTIAEIVDNFTKELKKIKIATQYQQIPPPVFMRQTPPPRGMYPQQSSPPPGPMPPRGPQGAGMPSQSFKPGPMPPRSFGPPSAPEVEEEMPEKRSTLPPPPLREGEGNLFNRFFKK